MRSDSGSLIWNVHLRLLDDDGLDDVCEQLILRGRLWSIWTYHMLFSGFRPNELIEFSNFKSFETDIVQKLESACRVQNCKYGKAVH